MDENKRTFLQVLGRRLRKMHTLDIIAVALVLLVMAILGVFLIHRSQITHEEADAQAITDQVVTAIAKQDTATVRKLGTKDFQTQFDKADLSKQLKTFAILYGSTRPSVDEKLVSNNSTRQYVAVTYKYDRLKVDFFVRVDVVKPSGSSKWYLQALNTGNNGPASDPSQPTEST